MDPEIQSYVVIDQSSQWLAGAIREESVKSRREALDGSVVPVGSAGPWIAFLGRLRAVIGIQARGAGSLR
jgi:hypothetical protein